MANSACTANANITRLAAGFHCTNHQALATATATASSEAAVAYNRIGRLFIDPF